MPDAKDVAKEAVLEAGYRIAERLKKAAREATDEVAPSDLQRINDALADFVEFSARKAAGEENLDVEIAGAKSVLSGYAFVAASIGRAETLEFATGVAEDVAMVAGAAAKVFARSLGIPIP